MLRKLFFMPKVGTVTLRDELVGGEVWGYRLGCGSRPWLGC